MTISISLEGLLTSGPPEDRAIALIKVNYNEQEYDWKTYIPADHLGDINAFLVSTSDVIQAQIDEKELEWLLLDPKTRHIDDGTEYGMVVPIEKNEVVKPDEFDYYARRRNEYAPVGEQLDAILKGYDSPEFQSLVDKHLEIKHRNYKLPRTLAQVKLEQKNEINRIRDRLEQSGFEYLGKIFDSDSVSVKRIGIVVQAAAMAGDDFVIDWTTQDGSTILLSKADIMMLPITMALVANALHTKARTLKHAIDNATTIYDVNQVVWS